MAAVNVVDAAPQVLAALPGMTPENLQSLLALRSDPSVDPHALIALSGGEGATLAGSKAYRITVDVELPDGQRSGGEVVILLLESGDEPYRVLSWRNNSDGSTAPQKVSAR
jgi:general secretion pathway protein K